ncbi:transglycosylase domain-containing protein [Brevibacillus borstelensis]|uniref:transglycosylase domain-containing protein n=1 Tax=Brevibacillus borstelensis TaxID=45462 RepID=UPI00203EACF4|nr:transglycosylase domain-containing protein [Brevibacillus borstelensis]MCM3469357.1 transglycosylase domain-containing protein [Brevibacillus borstelensis]MCM3622361.1 transglycosylase domain-containing protein [Brevibacillus borstelensis]
MNPVTLTTNEINPLPRVETKRIRPVGNWKKWIAVLSLCIICLTYLVPSLMTTAGSAWIDDSRLQALKDSSSGYIPIEEMPEHLWKAFVAIEDHRFMQHGGVDPAALARAVWIDLQEGAYVQGGSTITMQLARNLFLTQDKTMWRKMKEMAIAMELERRYTKQEILEMYLNVIYFGHGQYGIGNAAQFYFGKGNSQAIDTLTVGESAILASLPKAPEAYSPVKHSEKAMARQHLVLERMTELKILSQQEKEKALAEKIQVRQP